MTTDPIWSYSDEQLEQGIVNALKAGDIKAVETIMLVLAGQNPDRATLVFDTLKLGVAYAKSTRGVARDD